MTTRDKREYFRKASWIFKYTHNPLYWNINNTLYQHIKGVMCANNSSKTWYIRTSRVRLFQYLISQLM